MVYPKKRKLNTRQTARESDSVESMDESQCAIRISNLCFSLVDNIMETFSQDKRLSPAKLYEASYACGNYLCWTLLEQDYDKQAVQIAFMSYLRFLQGFNYTLLELPRNELINRFNASMERMGKAVSRSGGDSFHNPYRLLAQAIISEASAAPVYDKMLIMQVFMSLTDWHTRIMPIVSQLRLL